MKKYFAVVLTILAMNGTPAFAHTAPVTDPAVIAAVKEMFISMNYRQVMVAGFRQLGQTMPAMMRSTVTNMVNQDPKLSAADKTKLMAQIEKAIPGAVDAANTMLNDPALIDEIIAETVPLYANTYTVTEIHQIAAFYQSPVGRKMLINLPNLMSESIAISNKIIRPRIGKFVEQVMQNVAK